MTLSQEHLPEEKEHTRVTDVFSSSFIQVVTTKLLLFCSYRFEASSASEAHASAPDMLSPRTRAPHGVGVTHELALPYS